MKQLVTSIVALTALVLATGCEATGAEQDYNKATPAAAGGTGAVGAGAGGGGGGGASPCAAYTCGENPAVMPAGKFCGAMEASGFLPPACMTDAECADLPESTCMQSGMTTGCIKTCT